MRITALYNKEGVIEAAVMVDGEYRGPVPVAEDGDTLGTFEVPQAAAELRLDDICRTFRVDARSKTLIDPKRSR